jgi:hypothetical protein
MIRWKEYLVHVGQIRNAYRILVGKLQVKSPWRIWVNNIKRGFKETVFYGVYWIQLAQNRDQSGLL